MPLLSTLARHGRRLARLLAARTSRAPRTLWQGRIPAAHDPDPATTPVLPALDQLAQRLPLPSVAVDSPWALLADELWSPPALAADAPDPLAPLFAAGFAELAVLNLQRLGSRLAPFSVDCPGGWLAGCSESSLRWRQLLQQGREAGPRRLLELLKLHAEQFQVDDALRPADLLLRHGEMELLADDWLVRRDASSARSWPRHVRPGGLRRQGYLLGTDEPAGPHGLALQALGALSPLSGLVYLDRLPTLENPAAAAALQRLRSAADAQARPAWIALLANSLHGALLSQPSLAQTPWPARPASPPGAAPRSGLGWPQGAERMAGPPRGADAAHLMQRLRRWQAVATTPTDVHVATLHRLAQLALRLSAPDLQARWRDAGPWRALRRDTLLLDREHSPYLAALELLLLGLARADAETLLAASERAALLGAADALLDLQPEHAGPSVGGCLAAGGRDAAAQGKVCDFWSDDVPLTLPFADAPRWTHCVSKDYRALLERLVAAKDACSPDAAAAPAAEPGVADLAAATSD